MAQILFSNIYPEGKPLSNIIIDSKEVKYVKTGVRILYDTLKEYSYTLPTLTVVYPKVIPRNGGTVTPEVSYTQKRTPIGHSGKRYTTETLEGTVESFTASVYNDYNSGAVLDSETGAVYRGTLGTTPKSGEWTVMSVDISCTINGMSATKRASVKMESNKATTIYGSTTYENVIAGEIVNCTIPAKGGNAKVTAAKGRQLYKTTPTYKEYETGDIEITKYGEEGEQEIYPSILSHSTYVKSKGTEESGITTIYQEEVVWKSKDGDENKNASEIIWIKLGANTIEYSERSGPYYEGGNTTYEEVEPGSITLNSNKDIPASGGTITFTASPGFQRWVRDDEYEYYILLDVYTSEARGNEYREYSPEPYRKGDSGRNDINPDESTKSITGKPLGISETSRSYLGYVTFTWKGINSTKTKDSNPVYLQANNKEGIYGGSITYEDVIVTNPNKSTTVLASGTDNEVIIYADTGYLNYTVNDKYYLYTSGSREVILEGYSDIETISPVPPYIKVTKVDSKEDNISDTTIVDSATVVWKSLDKNSNNDIIGKLTIYQEANEGVPSGFDIEEAKVEYPPASGRGGIVTPSVSITGYKNIEYTSGFIGRGTSIDESYFSGLSVNVTKVTGDGVLGISGDSNGSISWGENNTTNLRFAEITGNIRANSPSLNLPFETIATLYADVSKTRGRKIVFKNLVGTPLWLSFTNCTSLGFQLSSLAHIETSLTTPPGSLDSFITVSCSPDSSGSYPIKMYINGVQANTIWCSENYHNENAIIVLFRLDNYHVLPIEN